LDDTQRANRIKAIIQKASVFNIAQAKSKYSPYGRTTSFSSSAWNQQVLAETEYSLSNIRKHAAPVMDGDQL